MKRILFVILSGLFALGAVLMAQQRGPQLPEPQPSHPNPSRVVPRSDNALPKAPAGFTVDIYADNIQGPRMMEWAPNGDLFVSQTSTNTVAVLRDANNDGIPEQRSVFLQGPPPPQRGRGPEPAPGGARGAFPPVCMADAVSGRQPYGIAFQAGYVYIGYTDCIVRYPYKPGDTQFQGKPEPLVYLPGGGNHFARNVAFSRDGKKMYVATSSAGFSCDTASKGFAGDPRSTLSIETFQERLR
jgi:glucose/arabinose dehydrogenase